MQGRNVSSPTRNGQRTTTTYLGASVAFDIVRIKVSPAELHVEPVLVARRTVEDVLGVGEERGASDVPLVRRKEEDVGAGRVHLVRLSGMDRLLLDRLDLESLELVVENLTHCAKSIVSSAPRPTSALTTYDP